jgi:hypothetical protein
MGPSPEHNDNMILDWQNNMTQRIWIPLMQGGSPADYIIKNLSKNFPTGPASR